MQPATTPPSASASSGASYLSSVYNAYVSTLALSKDDSYVAEAVFCAYLSNIIHNPPEPVWLQVIGPPSSHKTESLRPYLGYEDTIDVSSLTPNSLISGYRDPDDNDPSLILKLDGKVLLIKDLTAIHSMDRISRDKIYGDLRDAFDGLCSKASGTAGLVRYTARFGVLCAVTEIVDAFARESQQLGERFLSFRTFRYMPSHRQACDYLRHVTAVAPSKHHWRTTLRTVVWDALTALKQQSRNPSFTLPSPTDTQREVVIALAHLISQFRTSPINDTPVTGEMASRLVQQLTAITSCRAFADGRTEWNDDDLSLARRIALDTLPVQRRRLLMTLYHKDTLPPPPMSATQLAAMARCTVSEAASLMRQYTHTNLVSIARPDGPSRERRYTLSPDVRDLIRFCGLLSIGHHLPGLWSRQAQTVVPDAGTPQHGKPATA